MPRISKRKVQLQLISDQRSSGKRRRLERNAEIKFAFRAQQLEEADFRNKYKNLASKTSSDESSSDESSNSDQDFDSEPEEEFSSDKVTQRDNLNEKTPPLPKIMSLK